MWPSLSLSAFIHKLIQNNWSFIVLFGLMLVALLLPFDFTWAKLELQTWGLFHEPWRLLTAHLLHEKDLHGAANLVNFLLLRLVFREWLGAWSFVALYALLSVAIAVGLSFFTEFETYIGFSGVLYGLMACLIVMHWRYFPMGYLTLGALVIVKTVHELLVGADPKLEQILGVHVATEAHVFGLVAGVVYGFVYVRFVVNRHVW